MFRSSQQDHSVAQPGRAKILERLQGNTAGARADLEGWLAAEGQAEAAQRFAAAFLFTVAEEIPPLNDEEGSGPLCPYVRTYS